MAKLGTKDSAALRTLPNEVLSILPDDSMGIIYVRGNCPYDFFFFLDELCFVLLFSFSIKEKKNRPTHCTSYDEMG